MKVINQCKLWWKLGYAELHCVLNVDLEVKEYFKFVKLEYNYIKELYEKYNNQRNLFFDSRDELDTLSAFSLNKLSFLSLSW